MYLQTYRTKRSVEKIKRIIKIKKFGNYSFLNTACATIIDGDGGVDVVRALFVDISFSIIDVIVTLPWLPAAKP